MLCMFFALLVHRVLESIYFIICPHPNARAVYIKIIKPTTNKNKNNIIILYNRFFLYKCLPKYTLDVLSYRFLC